MFWNRGNGHNGNGTKLSKPGDIPEFVKSYLINVMKIDSDAPNFLQAVVCSKEPKDKSFHIRIFDPDEAMAMNCTVKDYTSLDTAPNLIYIEGSYQEKAKTCELVEKRKVNFNIDLLSQDKMLEQIQSLKEPGSNVFFYQSSGSASGGPLGRGASIIELQPAQPGKKPRYSIYWANVIEMQPVSQRSRVWESNNPVEIAKWVKANHVKRFC